MKRIIFLTTLASLAVLGAQAQTTPSAKVTVKPAKVRDVETPMFTANNVGDRSWRPKKWLELDTEFEVRLPASAGGRNGSVESMVVNVFVGLNHKSKAGKFEFIKGSFTCVDVPSGDKCHLLAYVSPAMLHRILEKDQFSSSSDVQAWGIEILIENTRVAAESSTGSPWWEKAENLEQVDGAMLSKKESPFAMLWGDYDVNVKK